MFGEIKMFIRLQPTPLNGVLRKMRQMTVVPGKEVPFVGPHDYILYSDPYISEKPSSRGPILTGRFLRPKTALTWGCSNIKLPLIVIVAP